MARLASNEIRPSVTVFYDDLDTVRFSNDVKGEARKARDLAASGIVMVSILVGNVAPILSYAQSFDNQLLLTLLLPEGSAADREDRLALLRLARAGFIQVGLMERNLSDNPPDGERYTILNAFRKSLSDPKFVLSGWPELNDAPELRQEVIGYLNSTSRNRVSADVPTSVGARIEGLREFDRNVRQSPTGIQIVSQAGEPLEGRVTTMLRALIASGEDIIPNVAAVVTGQAKREILSLNSRSAWYRLIEWGLQHPELAGESELRMLRDLIDVNYNAMMSESLSDDGMSLSVRDESVAGTAAEEFTPGESPGKRWADLSPAPGKGEWLRWSDVPELLTKLQVLRPDERLRELEQRQGLWIASHKAQHSWSGSVKIALPGAAGTAISGFATSIMTSATPSQAAGVAALTGVATLIAATPGVRALKARRIAKQEERLRARDERSTIRTGAAAWLERLRRPQ